MRYWVECETEFKPDANQTQVPGTEEKAPQKVRPTVGQFDSLAIAKHAMTEVIAHYYPKGS